MSSLKLENVVAYLGRNSKILVSLWGSGILSPFKFKVKQNCWYKQKGKAKVKIMILNPKVVYPPSFQRKVNAMDITFFFGKMLVPSLCIFKMWYILDLSTVPMLCILIVGTVPTFSSFHNFFMMKLTPICLRAVPKRK